jgi:ligand-binding SRPBCC domain-containing protein
MITVKTEVEIAAPVRICFDCARDIDLHTRTVWKHTREEAVGGVTSGPIGLDETVTFEATHFGVRQRLTSQITEYREPEWFVDEMQRGAFKSLRHEHEFQESNGITRMMDTLTFEAPFGAIGTLAERLVLGRYMRKFLEHRNRELKKRIERIVL